jgi:lipoprotein NlpI
VIAAAEATFSKTLSVAPEHPLAHAYLGIVQIHSNRAVQGIAECERALALDPNLTMAHAGIAVGKLFSGRAEETRHMSTKHSASALAIRARIGG